MEDGNVHNTCTIFLAHSVDHFLNLYLARGYNSSICSEGSSAHIQKSIYVPMCILQQPLERTQCLVQPRLATLSI